MRSPARRDAALFGLLLAAALVLPTLPLWLDQAAPHWDGSSFYFPAWSLHADAAREGELVLWNLWLAGGRPEAADPQLGSFSPLLLLLGFLFGGSLGGYLLYWFGLWLATAVGVHVLARHLGAPAWGAGIAAAGMLASGFAISHAQHLSFLATFAFLPWIVWRLDVAVEESRLVPAAQAGLLFGLSAVGGYPALVLVNLFFIVAWLLGRLLFFRAPGRSARQIVATLARTMLIALAVAGALAAPTYLAFFVEGRGFSDRVKPLTREIATTENALHPAALATFFSPGLAVAEVHDREVWGLRRFSMASCYVGAPALLLALLALVHRPRDRFRWWLAAIALASLACALGSLLPVRGWLYDLVPLTRYFRHPSIFRAPALLAVALLAALSAKDREELGAAWDRRLAQIAVGAAGFAAVILLGVRASDAGLSRELPLARILGAVAVFLLPALIVSFARSPRLGGRMSARLPALLIALALADAALAIWGCRRQIYFPRDEGYRQYLATHAALSGDRLDQTTRGLARRVISRRGHQSNLDVLARTPVLSSYDPFSAAIVNWYLQRPNLVAAATGANRIWFSPAAAEMPIDEAAVRKLSRRTRELGAPVLVLHPRGGAPAPALVPFDTLPPMVRPPLELLEYRPASLRFVVDAPAAGWLWVTDRWAAGWRAAVDGRPRPVWRAGFLFRAVEVPAGRSEVAFAYRPFGHPWLFWLSIAVTGGVVLASFTSAGRRVKEPIPGAEPAVA